MNPAPPAGRGCHARSWLSSGWGRGALRCALGKGNGGAQPLGPLGEVLHEVVPLAVEVTARAREAPRAAHARVAAGGKDPLPEGDLRGERLAGDGGDVREGHRRAGEVAHVVDAHRAGGEPGDAQQAPVGAERKALGAPPTCGIDPVMLNPSGASATTISEPWSAANPRSPCGENTTAEVQAWSSREKRVLSSGAPAARVGRHAEGPRPSPGVDGDPAGAARGVEEPETAAPSRPFEGPMKALALGLSLALTCHAAAAPAQPVPIVSPLPPLTTVAWHCAQACAYIERCVGRHDRECRSICESDLRVTRRAARYAMCARALSCAAIRRSMAMDSGPLGECFTLARRAEP